MEIKLKRGPADDATKHNPVLKDKEIAFETDTRKIKIGDGKTPWNDLPYQDELMPLCMAGGFHVF
jgi:hyaluronoglucosaminidase